MDKEIVTINIDGREQTMSFSLAFRKVWAQTLSIEESLVRLFMFDPLTDWCLTTFEKRVRNNQNVIKDYLRKKHAQHAVWRKENQISAENGSMICLADLLMADKKRFSDEDIVIDELIAACYSMGQITTSATTQLLYQLIRNQASMQKIQDEIKELFGESIDVRKTTLTASHV